MGDIDWMNTPLKDFLSAIQSRVDDTTYHEINPLGDGEAQRLLIGLSTDLRNAYGRLVPEEEEERFVTEGKVLLIREGRKSYEELARLTLSDLPAILDALVILEEDHKRREREENERKATERKARERVRAKERRKLKKLGER